ncbi:MAG: lamin tail domain-containing protein, partial [Myxococcota bacterium]
MAEQSSAHVHRHWVYVPAPLHPERLLTTFALVVTSMAAALLWTACSGSGSPGACSTSADCPTGLLCMRGVCGDGSSNTTSSNTTSSNTSVPECPDAPVAQMGDLVLNEVLADPPPDDDVNMDGIADTNADEFLEFVNISSGTVRMSGFELFKNDAAAPETTLDTECLDAGEALIIFGGLESGATPPTFAGARVEISKGSIQLNNGGATIKLQDPDGNIVVEATYDGATDQSSTLSPQLDPNGMYVDHTDLAEGVPYSLGTCPDGSPLSSGCTGGGMNNNGTDDCPEAPMPTMGDLVLNEIHADPDATDGDANGDGVADTSDDEFLEIVNISGQTLRTVGLELVRNGDNIETLTTTCLDA